MTKQKKIDNNFPSKEHDKSKEKKIIYIIDMREIRQFRVCIHAAVLMQNTHCMWSINYLFSKRTRKKILIFVNDIVEMKTLSFSYFPQYTFFFSVNYLSM